MKKSFFNFEFKSVEVKEGKVKIKWFASTPDVDRYDDIVDTKAFENSISTYMLNPVILLQHDSDKPIWKCIEYTLNEKWLEIVAEITENTDGVIDKLNNKILGAFSIGFIAKEWEFSEKEINGKARRIREIKDIDLVEISIVTTPANPQAVFSITKSLKKLFDEVENEEKEAEKTDWSNELPESNEVVAESPIENTQEIQESSEGAITDEIATPSDDEKNEKNDEKNEEKWCKNPKKRPIKKEYFEEKRVMLAWELKTWSLIRFTKFEYDSEYWVMPEMEVEVGEIVKILENEDITNPMLYILEYELTLDGFVPWTDMCAIPFRNTTIEIISKMQLKEFDEVEQEAPTDIVPNTDDAEILAEIPEGEIPAEKVIETPEDEIDLEAEVEKHFAKKSLDLHESLETKAKEFEERMDKKLADLDAKELSIKVIHNETAEIKKLADKNLEESKKIMERLLKITVNKWVATTTQVKAPNYFDKTL